MRGDIASRLVHVWQGVWRAFADNRKEVFELRLRHVKGYVGARVLKFLGDSRRMFVINGYDSTDSVGGGGGQTIPDIQEFQRAHPNSEFTSESPSIEHYAVI